MPKRKANSETVVFLGERLRTCRQELGLNQKTLADMAELAASTISGLEKGTVKPSARTIQQLALLLGRRAEYFTDPAVGDAESKLPNIQESHSSTNVAGSYPANSTSAGTQEGTDKQEEAKEKDGQVQSTLNLARSLLKSGKYEAALGELERLEKAKLNPAQARLVLYLQAQGLSRLKNTHSARQILRELQNKVESLGQTAGNSKEPSIAEIMFELGVSYYMDQQFEEAENHYVAALDRLGTSTAEREPVGFKLYAELGRVYRELGNPAKAAEYYSRATHHPAFAADDRTRAIMLQDEAISLVRSGHGREAQGKLAESIALFEKLELLEQAYSVSSYLKVVNAQLNQFDELDNVRLLPDQLPSLSPNNQLIVMINAIEVLRLKAEAGDTKALNEAEELLRRALQFRALVVDSDKLKLDTLADLSLIQARLHQSRNRREEAQTAFEETLQLLREDKARWPRFDRVYEIYTKALLDWDLKDELMALLKKSYEDKLNYNQLGFRAGN